MKKLILVLAILLSVPAFAAVSISLVKESPDGNKVDLNYNATDPCNGNLPRAFALIIEVNGTANVVDVNGYKKGESTSASRGYGIYPAKIVIDGNNGTVSQWGDPLAVQGAPGAYDQVLPSQKFVLEFGSLYAPVGDSANCPATSGTLCYLKMDCNSALGAVTIKATEEDAYRGGVVLENGTTPDPNLTASLLYQCLQEDTNCLKNGMVFSRTICDPCLTTDINITAAIMGRWAYVGRPNCWCCNAQKCGNGNYTSGSKTRVDAADLSSLKLSWFKYYTQAGYNPCVDFNLSGRVDAADLSVLKSHWFKTTGNSACM